MFSGNLILGTNGKLKLQNLLSFLTTLVKKIPTKKNENIFMKTNSLMFKSIQRVSVMLVINRIR